MYETLIVDGTDLATVVSCLESLDGLYQVGTPRGDNAVIPGVDGETYVDKPYGTQVVEFGVDLQGATTADFNESFRELKRLIRPGKQLSLERHLSYPGGDEVHVASGEWASGLNATVSLMRFGRTTFSLKIHDGLWYNQTSFTQPYANTTNVTINGETRTHRISLTMDAGHFVTNSTTGHTLSNNLAGGSGTVTVDVITMTATQGGIDVSASLSWNKRYPFQLVPGSNIISTDTAGNITYTEAYL